jgi:hypothetical protein
MSIPGQKAKFRGTVYHCPRVTWSALTLARAGQRGVAGVAAGCWVVGGAAAGRAAAGAAAGRTRGSQRPFTMRIFRALHLRTAARTAEFRTQMPSTS